MSRPIHAVVDLAALGHNLAVARSHAGDARVLAVIKADGYGHGLLRVARALASAEGFAVLSFADGVRLREAGFDQEIVLLEGFFSPDELPVLARHRLSSVVHSQWQLDALLRYSARPDIPVWLKVNTGMNRLGFPPGDFLAALRRLRESGAALTLMTHFPCADERAGVADPLRLFEHLTAGEGLPRSMANSAALLRFPETRGQWVRPGIMLYGSSPLPDRSAEELGLRPAMTLSSRIIAVREIGPGDAVGYGATFQASTPMRVGVVACGYADGYPRHAPTGTPVLVAGRRTRLVGRVSMDMLMVDLDPVPDAVTGSPVTLWGRGLSVDEVALAAGTVGYELLCAVAPRVPKSEMGMEDFDPVFGSAVTQPGLVPFGGEVLGAGWTVDWELPRVPMSETGGA